MTTDCLHCDINELVQKHLDREGADLAELAARMTESLADLILLAPEAEQSKLMADALANLGQAFLEKSGVEPDDTGARH
jgi:hypothetical protein